MNANRRKLLTLVAAMHVLVCHARPSAAQESTVTVKLPKKILPDLAWSFHEPLPQTPALLLAALRSYGEDIKVEVNNAELQDRFPLNALDIEYKYAERNSGGDWEDIPVTLRVRRTAPPSYLELLFEIHLAAGEILKDQDHCFFEGLWLLDRQNEKGVPVYELYLGS